MLEKVKEILRAPARMAALEQRMAVLEDALTPAAPGQDEEKMAKQWDCFWAYDGTEQEGVEK